MLSVLIIFIWMLVTTFLTGCSSIMLLQRLAGDGRGQRPDAIACAMAGIVVTTVYAQIWSLFAGVGRSTVIGLVLLSVMSAVYIKWEEKQMVCRHIYACQPKPFACERNHCTEKRDLKNKDEYIKTQGEAGKKAHFQSGAETRAGHQKVRVLGAWVVLFLLYAYGTSRGYIHYDSDLYHAQSIRWIETYGVVPGLANLHTRLGYNSASFALSALYSFAFLGGQSYHVCAGFLALLTAGECSKVLRIFRGKKPTAADFARLAGIYYLCTIFDEMVSPASDYFMVLCAFYLVIRFLTLAEEGVRDPFPYGLLAMLAVYTVTVKLSAVGLILLALFPLGIYLKRKEWRPILIFVCTALVISLPFLIRNVILTGWLFYPMTAIDLFSADWKVPPGTAQSDAREIKVWGRGYTDVSLYDLPMTGWVKDWFRGQASLDKIFLLMDLLAAPCILIMCVAEAAGYLRNSRRIPEKDKRRQEEGCTQEQDKGKYEKKNTQEHREKSVKAYREGRLVRLLVLMTILCSTAFWFLNAPLIRYGCVFVYLSAFVPVGMAAEYLLKKEEKKRPKGRKVLHHLCTAAVALFLCYKLLATGKEQAVQFQDRYWILQEDYNQYEVASYEIDGYTFYYPTGGDQAGYDPFPSSPVKARIRLRGEKIEDGFAAL